MNKSDLQRLIKVEERIGQIAKEEMKLNLPSIEFDVVPPVKMLEIMAYRSPANISNWKFGRDYERIRTIFENADPSLPLEVVINDIPARAYLMNSNTFALQALVISHVYGHCFLGGTFIETINGEKKIEDINIGDLVLTHKGRYKKVVNLGSRVYRGKAKKVKLSGHSNRIIVTPEHEFLAVKSERCTKKHRNSVVCTKNCKRVCKDRLFLQYKPEWTKIENLKYGDFLMFPKEKTDKLVDDFIDIEVDKVLHKQHITGNHRIEIDEDFARLIGYIISDGHIDSHNTFISFNINEIDLVNDAKRIIENIGLKPISYKRESDNVYQIGFCDISVSSYLKGKISTISGPENKKIPDFIYYSNNKEVLLECIKGIFLGDGYIPPASKGRNSSLFSITTISNKLFHQIRKILAKFDIFSSVFIKESNIKKGVHRQKSYDIIISGKSVHKLSKIFFGEDIIKGNRSFTQDWYSDDEYVYIKIKSIENVDISDYVYNIEVEDDNSYVLSIGCAVHNCNFFHDNKWFQKSRRDIITLMSEANRRFNEYERIYGIDEVEATIDAGHALQWHSNPFDDETEDERRIRIFEQRKLMHKPKKTSKFKDILREDSEKETRYDYETNLWRSLKQKSPVEPMSDLLRYIIDNSRILEDWQKDILETLRSEGQYYWPIIQTKFMNEGWACLMGDSLIDTNYGLTPIREIVKNKMQVSVFDGEEYKKITDYFENRKKRRIKIITKHGFELHGGYDHKIYNNKRWIKLSDLKIGDKIFISKGGNEWNKDYIDIDYVTANRRITQKEIMKKYKVHPQTIGKLKNGNKIVNKNNCIQRAKNALKEIIENKMINPGISRRFKISIPKILDEDFATYLGLMVGDGNIGYRKWGEEKRVKNFQNLTTGDDQIRDSFSSLTKKLFNIDASIKKQENRWRIMNWHAYLTDFLVNYMGLKYSYCAGEKEVPKKIMSSPKSVVAAFIRAYFDADAHCTENGNIILITKSEKLAKQVQEILLKFGIYSVVSIQKSKFDDMRRLVISGIDSKLYMEQIGFNLDRKMNRLCNAHKNRKFYWEKKYETEIIRIEIDEGTTYDFTVDDTHRYFARGFINHNCLTHTRIMNQLFKEGLLTNDEHGQFNYSNSLVKAMHPHQMNPYLVGYTLWEDIKERWDKGRHGTEWEECTNLKEKENWDTGEMKGEEKIRSIKDTYTDWFFFNEFLTHDLIKKLKLYIYYTKDMGPVDDDIIGDFKTEEIRKMIVGSFSNSGIPKIYVIDGSNELQLIHGWTIDNCRNDLDVRRALLKEKRNTDMQLDETYTKNTLRHISNLWGNTIILLDGEKSYKLDKNGGGIFRNMDNTKK